MAKLEVDVSFKHFQETVYINVVNWSVYMGSWEASVSLRMRLASVHYPLNQSGDHPISLPDGVAPQLACFPPHPRCLHAP